MNVPSWIYKEYALGNVPHDGLMELEKLAEGLSAGTAALMVGTALLSPLLATAGAAGAEKIMDRIDDMNFDRDLKAVLEVNPDIGKVKDKQVRLAYRSIRTTNSKFSKDPLIAGTLLRQILQNRVNPYDPKSPARVDLNIASQLSNASGRGSARELATSSAAQSIGALPTALLEAHGGALEASAKKKEDNRRFDLQTRQHNEKKRDNRMKHLQWEVGNKRSRGAKYTRGAKGIRDEYTDKTASARRRLYRMGLI